jgi:hypothetical protein
MDMSWTIMGHRRQIAERWCIERGDEILECAGHENESDVREALGDLVAEANLRAAFFEAAIAALDVGVDIGEKAREAREEGAISGRSWASSLKVELTEAVEP